MAREFRSFGWPSRLLMINQFGINLGFPHADEAQHFDVLRQSAL